MVAIVPTIAAIITVAPTSMWPPLGASGEIKIVLVLSNANVAVDKCSEVLSANVAGGRQFLSAAMDQLTPHAPCWRTSMAAVWMRWRRRDSDIRIFDS